jgi:hypothetical protein
LISVVIMSNDLFLTFFPSVAKDEGVSRVDASRLFLKVNAEETVVGVEVLPNVGFDMVHELSKVVERSS